MDNLTEIDMQNIRLALTVEVRQANERGHYGSAYQHMLTYNKCNPDTPYTRVDLQEMREEAIGIYENRRRAEKAYQRHK